MNSEMRITRDALKRSKRKGQPASWRHAFPYLAFLSAMLLGGTWLGCRGENTYWGTNPSDDNRASAPSLEHGAGNQVEWLRDYDEAIAQAKRLDRPVLIDFAASWCAPCVMMDKHVWPKPTVLEALDSKVVPLRVDVDAKVTLPLVEKYKIEFLPTVLLIDAEGQELKREGFVDAEQLIEMIKSAM